MLLAVQIAHPYKYAGENVDLQGLNVFKVLKMLILMVQLSLDPFLLLAMNALVDNFRFFLIIS